MATDLTPAQIVGASFRTVRKGYDSAEVDAFLERAAAALEAAQQQATSMEARARAAVARLQEASAASAAAAPATETVVPGAPAVRHDEHAVGDLSAVGAETISRTLLLAQLTAETTVAEAESEAARIRREAQAEAESTIDSTREMSARLVDDARLEARRANESERKAAENEVESLKARREFLVGDVDQLEQFLVDQRERLRGAARQIEALVDRVPSGLGQVRPPVLSASDDEPDDARHDEPVDEAPDDIDDQPVDGSDDDIDDEPFVDPDDDTDELLMPEAAVGPFVDVHELAEAIDQGETQQIPMLDLSTTANDDDQPPSNSAADLPKRNGIWLSD